MIVREYLRYLVDTDLKNLHFVDEITGELKENKLDKLMSLLNAGLRELSTRFDLQTDNIHYRATNSGIHTLDLKHSREVYSKSDIVNINHITCTHGRTDELLSGNDLKDYIVPRVTEETFQQKSLSLNLQDALYQPENHQAFYCLQTPTKIQVYSPYQEARFVINVRTVLGVSGLLQLSDELPVPTAYYNALGLYMASRLFRSMNNQLDGDVNESMQYYQAYQQEIMMLEQQGIELDTQPQTKLFHSRGFV